MLCVKELISWHIQKPVISRSFGRDHVNLTIPFERIEVGFYKIRIVFLECKADVECRNQELLATHVFAGYGLVEVANLIHKPIFRRNCERQTRFVIGILPCDTLCKI